MAIMDIPDNLVDIEFNGVENSDDPDMTDPDPGITDLDRAEIKRLSADRFDIVFVGE